jgi:hypothetical protein
LVREMPSIAGQTRKAEECQAVTVVLAVVFAALALCLVLTLVLGEANRERRFLYPALEFVTTPLRAFQLVPADRAASERVTHPSMAFVRPAASHGRAAARPPPIFSA